MYLFLIFALQSFKHVHMDFYQNCSVSIFKHKEIFLFKIDTCSAHTSAIVNLAALPIGTLKFLVVLL